MHASDPSVDEERQVLYERLARKALVTYGLESSSLRLLSYRGKLVFRVEAEHGRWALRICPPESNRKALMRELLWLVAINLDTDLGVPEPVLTPSGGLFDTVSMRGLSGFRAFSLLRWVHGQKADELSESHCEALGRFTGTLHRHAQSFDWPQELAADRMWLDRLPERTLRGGWTKTANHDQIDAVREALPALQRVLRTMEQGREAVGPVHGGLFGNHLLFHQGEARAIDFGSVHWNYYGYDIAVSLRRTEVAGSEAKTEAYLRGYTHIRPLPCDLGLHRPAFDFLAAIVALEPSPVAPPRPQ
jgi:Ser/Thr protein kinase RdoA (MazF antagonist)